MARPVTGKAKGEGPSSRIPAAALDFRTPIPSFVQSCPVLLMPVRLETRYADAGRELRIRIYPDQIHLNMHDPELTVAEIAAGQWYWTQLWPATGADAEATLARDALRKLTRTFDEARARWLVFRLTPTNLTVAPRHNAPLFPNIPARHDGWRVPARAELQPDRWIASAFADDGKVGLTPVFTKQTAPVANTLNASPDPDAAPGGGPNGKPGLSADPDFRWTTDFDQAERCGMALRVRAEDLDMAARARGCGIGSPLARLVVWGWRSGEASQDLVKLLDAHAHSQGLSIPVRGTPTNLTEEAGALSASASPAAAPGEPSALDQLSTALGMPSLGTMIGDGEGARSSHGEAAGRVADLLWNATLGLTLDQLGDPLISDTSLDALRDHATRWVRPEGPLPPLRVGHQPYGILPVMASNAFRGATSLEGHLHAIVDGIRPFWVEGLAGAPKLDKPGETLDRNFEEVLQQGPMAQSMRFRRVLGPHVSGLTGFNTDLKAVLNSTTNAVLKQAGVAGNPRIAGMVAEANALRLDIPWVRDGDATVSAAQPLPFLADLAAVARANNPRSLLADRKAPESLLEMLTTLALIYEIDKDAAEVAYGAMKSRGLLAGLPQNVALRLEELVNLDATPTPKGRIATGAALASARLGKRTAPMSKGLKSTLDALGWLSNRASVELECALCGWLDSCSWRLDAWVTSLATRRLADWRKRADSKGLHIGAFGWVENLKPDAGPDSEGFIHAPSMHHANTAAMLYSAHLAHRDAAPESFAIDLSSRRVRQALALLEAVRQGIPLGESLGLRFENLVQQRGAGLVKFIKPLRMRYPGSSSTAAGLVPIDGVTMIEARRAHGDWLVQALPGATRAQRDAIDACAAELDAVLDAVSDLLLAESVHQIAGGNAARAAAALSALDRQTLPPDIEVARTPTGGTSFEQRVIVMLGTDQPPKAWRDLPGDGRAIAEPRLNAWLASQIGEPGRIALAASAVDPDGKRVRPLAPLGLGRLGYSPLSLVMLCAPGPASGVETLRSRVAAAMLAQLTEAERQSGLSVLVEEAAPPGSDLGLAELEVLLSLFARAIVGKRGLAPPDLAPAGSGVTDEAGGLELQGRADQLHAMFATAREALAQAIGVANPSGADLMAAIAGATRAGCKIAVPTVADAASLASEALATLDEALDRERAVALPDTGDATAAVHQMRRIKALLGEDFPVLPVLDGGDPHYRDVWASLGDQKSLMTRAALPLQSVLRQMCRVRPALATMADALEASELVLGQPSALAAVHLPHVPGTHWIGLPFGDAPPRGVEASLIVHTQGINPTRPPAHFSGVFVDAWTETIPAQVARTGVAIHYDAPAARPPQSLLLAVHPDPGKSSWTPQLILDSIAEALDLARLRAVRPQDLPPMGMALPLLYLPENSLRDVPSVDTHAARDRARQQAAGKA